MRTPEQIQAAIIACRDEHKIAALQKEYAETIDAIRRNASREKFVPKPEKPRETNLVVYKTKFEGKRLVIIN